MNCPYAYALTSVCYRPGEAGCKRKGGFQTRPYVAQE